MKTTLMAALAAVTLITAVPAAADDYKIDPTHSFVTFTIPHLGYSLLQGRFNTLSGSFSHDPAKPAASTIMVEIDTASIDSNHAERDKHLRGDDFLNVKKYPTATFKSTGFTPKGNGGTLKGKLTLHGVTKSVMIPVTAIGAGKDPWGGYRSGWKGELTLKRADYGISYNLGPAAESVTLGLFIEGIRK
ncbi:MAG: YceI family protein [Magnetococcales bacterium]|nr:YceI family protein [Magnetococcales bacterium]